VLRIGHMKRLPYVARLARGVEDTERGTVVTSVGIDLGERLSSWRTHVEGIGWFRLEKQDEDRPFLITSKPPEHGRSGGGLFSPDGVLVGVCIGRAEVGEKKGSNLGIFAAAASIRRMLRDHDLEQAVARSSPPARGVGRAGPSTGPGPITPTEATRVAPPGRP